MVVREIFSNWAGERYPSVECVRRIERAYAGDRGRTGSLEHARLYVRGVTDGSGVRLASFA